MLIYTLTHLQWLVSVLASDAATSAWQSSSPPPPHHQDVPAGLLPSPGPEVRPPPTAWTEHTADSP